MSELSDAAIAHLIDCEPCRREQSEIVTLMRDPLVRAELDRERQIAIVGDAGAGVRRDAASRGARKHFTRIAAAGLAAAAALLIAVRLAPRHGSAEESPTALRHATIDVARASQLIAPLGVVGHVDSMIWTSVPHADLYRVSIFDTRGHVVWETESPDTTVRPPTAVLERSPGELRWRVKARTSFDQWIDSEFAEFSLEGDR